jgi:group I intron endonuclease
MQNIIYKITSHSTSKVYIGQTWQALPQRFNEHKSKSKCHKLVNAFNKYGKDNFKIEFITVCHTQECADKLEVEFIQKYDSIKNGYNIRSGGSKGKHSKETVDKMSGVNNPMFGKKHTAETIMLMSQTHLGQKCSDETRAKLSNLKKGKANPHKGHAHSVETRLKMSQSRMAYFANKKVG